MNLRPTKHPPYGHIQSCLDGNTALRREAGCVQHYLNFLSSASTVWMYIMLIWSAVFSCRASACDSRLQHGSSCRRLQQTLVQYGERQDMVQRWPEANDPVWQDAQKHHFHQHAGCCNAETLLHCICVVSQADLTLDLHFAMRALASC